MFEITVERCDTMASPLPNYIQLILLYISYLAIYVTRFRLPVRPRSHGWMLDFMMQDMTAEKEREILKTV